MAGDGFKIAEAYVDIKAKMDGRAIKREIQNGLREAGLPDVGRDAGREISDGINEVVGKRAKDSGKEISDAMEKSGRDSREGFSGHFRGLVGVVGEVAKSSIGLFNDLFNFNSPLLTVAVLAAAISALPLVASAATVGIVAIFGAAFASIGIFAAVHNEEVVRSFHEAWNNVKAIADSISEPFVLSLKKVAEEFQYTFQQFAPHLKDAFASMAPHIDTFVSNFGVAVRRLIPAIGPVTEAFNVLLDRLGARMPDLFEAIANTVTHLSEVLKENPGAVDAVVGAFIGILDVSGAIIGFFTECAGWLQRNAETAGALFKALFVLVSPASAVAQELFGVGEMGSAADQAMSGMMRAAKDSAVAMGEALTAAGSLSQSMDDLTRNTLSAEQAELKFDQSVLKMTKSIEDNGTSLNTHTKEGSDNKEALLRMAQAANDVKDKFIEQGASSDVVREKSVKMREEMVAQAEKLGFTRQKAQELIDKYFAIPTKVETAVNAPGAVDTKNKIDDVKNSANNMPTRKDIVVNAQDNASSIINNIKNALLGIGGQFILNITGSKDGNIVNFASGSERHIAQISGAGSMRLWAEPETGGEAYIPLAPSKRPRSQAILSNVAERFGLTLARPMADGGVIDSIRNGGSGLDRSVVISSLNVSVNLAGVWDFTDPTKAREIANKIAPAIREAIRVDERRYA